MPDQSTSLVVTTFSFGMAMTASRLYQPVELILSNGVHIRIQRTLTGQYSIIRKDVIESRFRMARNYKEIAQHVGEILLLAGDWTLGGDE